jgi:hypothetical protein
LYLSGKKVHWIGLHGGLQQTPPSTFSAKRRASLALASPNQIKPPLFRISFPLAEKERMDGEQHFMPHYVRRHYKFHIFLILLFYINNDFFY